MAEFKVTPEELKAGSTKLGGVAGNIRTELDAAKSEAERLGGGWTGGAQVSFEGLMSQWNDIAGKQQENLHQIADLLSKAADGYADAEQTASSNFSG